MLEMSSLIETAIVSIRAPVRERSFEVGRRLIVYQFQSAPP